MTRLPRRLERIWPLVKRLHLWSSAVSGVIGRNTRWLQGQRALPARAGVTADETAALDSQNVTVHRTGQPVVVDRPAAVGNPPGHWIFEPVRSLTFAPQCSLAIEGGTVVGEYAAIVTPNGVLDAESSNYWGVKRWQNHPLFLRRRMPRPTSFDGTLAVLGTRGGSDNYFHFVTDVLPRWGTLRATLPDEQIDALFVPRRHRYQRELLELAGLGDLPAIEPGPDVAVTAKKLIVPNLTNVGEDGPPFTVDWLRGALPAKSTQDKPARIYVTRGSKPNTRRFVREAELLPELAKRGFTVVDPGALSVQEQIDHFAAADVIVGPHGAAMTNLAFVHPGAKVLEFFARDYVRPCFWSLTINVPGVDHRYQVAGRQEVPPPGRGLNKVQADIDMDPAVALAAVDELLEA